MAATLSNALPWHNAISSPPFSVEAVLGQRESGNKIKVVIPHVEIIH